MRIIILLICNFIFSFAIVYDFEANNFFNKKINFNNFKKDILVVFVSYDDCKLTKELMSLNNLYAKYKTKKVKFIGFAINSVKIKDKKFCSINYGVDFDMFDKYNNNVTKLFKYTKKIYLNKEIFLYSPIVIYDNKMIRLNNDISLLDNAISKALQLRK